jgi:hypothetical protein
MDLQPMQQPISDDQELAKVLAGVTEEADESQAAGAGTLPGVPVLPPLPTTLVPTPAAPAPVVDPAELEEASAQAVAQPEESPVATPAPAADGALDGVKKEAISELRPLVGKLNVSPEEKFDTYLLLIRSTDDKSLIAPAHEAAKAIEDEARRADALLNIIKEIDYLSGPAQ